MRRQRAFTPLQILFKQAKKEKFVRGFTFVELLIVVTIFSILSLAVYATFVSGMQMWRRMQDMTLSQRKAMLGLEKFSQELRQALNFSKIGFSGKSNEFFFPALSGEDILRVTYSLEGKKLLRKQENFKDILEKKEEAKVNSLFSDLDDLKFSFAYQEEGKTKYSWKDAWEKEDGIPAIVKIEFKIKDANFARAIYLPVS